MTLLSNQMRSTLKDLAEKACWDVAETKAKGDRQLLEYLVRTCCGTICSVIIYQKVLNVLFMFCKVYLAMEAGYYEKVDELCERYSLEGLPKAQGMCCFVLLNFS